MKRMMFAALMLSALAGFARADGDADEKPDVQNFWSPPLPDPIPPVKMPAIKAKPVPASYEVPQRKPVVKPVGQPAVGLDLRPDRTPEQFWLGAGVFGGSKFVGGADLEGGWIPSFYQRISLNVGLGGVFVHSTAVRGENNDLGRLYGRVSLMHEGPWKTAFGPYYAQIGRTWSQSTDSPTGNTGVKKTLFNGRNTDKTVGGTAEVKFSSFKFGVDVGYNTVHDGFTPYGLVGGLRLIWVFANL